MADDFIRAGEFERTMDTVTKKIDDGFAAVHERFDKLNPVVMEHDRKIAVLEDRSKRAEAAALMSTQIMAGQPAVTVVPQPPAPIGRPTRIVLFGSGAVGVLSAVFKLVKSYWMGH